MPQRRGLANQGVFSTGMWLPASQTKAPDYNWVTFVMSPPRMLILRSICFLDLVGLLLSPYAVAGEKQPAQTSVPASAVPTPAANEEVRKVTETFAARGVQRDQTPAFSPSEALRTFTLREGYVLDQMAAEPDVTQPLYMSWDSRGRMWVVEYLQYQFPAGLKIVSYDQHLRAQFDRVPEPPPKGEKGADRIVVFEPTNGTRFEKPKLALDGLNLVSSVIKGAGGIWVLNPPYLLFYPDANDDDIPDGDPQVALRGFGMEDTHSVANSLHWGPDGWLYGANGSTTTGNVSSAVTKNVRFQGQHLWRFHPKTQVFEIYAEGGGNTFSAEIDAQGRFFSGTNGSQRGMHYDQGMSGVKAFGKHGPPLNPYAFGYFDHIETRSDNKRFSQTFAIYDGGIMPELSGRFLAANSLQNMCYVSAPIPVTSTFRADDEPELLRSSDRWFRPVDLKVGPDGCIYLADWYDTRLSHVSTIDDWSKSDGRIYRVRPKGQPPRMDAFDLHTEPVSKSIERLSHPNKWFRQQAALELSWRNERDSLPRLISLASDPQNLRALDALFAVHMLGGLDDGLSTKLLLHPDPYVRRWVVRCAGDSGSPSNSIAEAFGKLAERENHPEVRTQLLCSAKRFPIGPALKIIRPMMTRDEDLADQRIPLLLWWALEAKAETDRSALLELFRSADVWDSKLASTYGARNLAKRYALAGGAQNFETCAELLASAKRDSDRSLLIDGITEAFAGGKIPQLPEPLQLAINTHLKTLVDSDVALGIKTGDEAAIKKGLAIALDKKASLPKRISVLEAFSESGNQAFVPTLLSVLSSARDSEVALRLAALAAAVRFDDVKIAQNIVSGYESRFAGNPTVRDAAHRALAARKEWASLLLEQVDQHRIRTSHVARDIRQQIAAYHEPALDALLQKHWPPTSGFLSSADKRAEVSRIKSVLVSGAGDSGKGRELFAQRCAACHVLFGKGGQVGPELTGYERTNLDFWLPAILEPSLEIREGFGGYICKLTDGQLLIGILERQDASGTVLRDLAGQRRLIRPSELLSLEAAPTSLMPEGLLQGMSDSQLLDIFSYLSKPDGP